MPLIQIDLDQSLYDAKKDEISREIHQAQVEIEALGIPVDDKFQVFRPRGAGELVFDPSFNGVDRRSLVLIQILTVHRYPVVLKEQLYLNLIRRLAGIGIRPDDVLIALVENGYEDWKPGALADEVKSELGGRGA